MQIIDDLADSNLSKHLLGHLFNWSLFGVLSVQVCELPFG